MTIQQFQPPHPGGFIKRVYLIPNNLSSNAVAIKLKVSPSTFNRLINEKADISPKMALKLSKVLGRSPESWLMMQDHFDLWKVKKVVDLESYEPIQFTM
jgi:addiction module HigA family antidote